jgi:hypothetical protein
MTDPERFAAEHEGRRHAWLKLLRLCLTELGVEEPTALYITAIVDRANPRRQMVVQRIVIVHGKVHVYGDDPSFYVIGTSSGPGESIKIGDTITYVPDGPDHGWLVTEPQEPQP